MKDLIILGAGNVARELIQIINEINAEMPTWRIKGFLCDIESDIEKKTNGEFSVIGTIRDWVPQPNELFVCAVSDPQGRQIIIEPLKRKGANFVSIIGKGAEISSYSTIGSGVIVYPSVRIGPNVSINDYAFIQCSVAHDCVVEEYSALSGGAIICGNCHLGKRSFVSAGAVLVPHIRIGDDSFVGAGSVVIRNVKNGKKVFGNPAKVIEV